MFFGKKSLNRLGNITKQITPGKRVGTSLLCPVKKSSLNETYLEYDSCVISRLGTNLSLSCAIKCRW